MKIKKGTATSRARKNEPAMDDNNHRFFTTRKPSERQSILVRGPAEAALSSQSYSTHYSESMSYSYGAHSTEENLIADKLSDEKQTNTTIPSN